MTPPCHPPPTHTTTHPRSLTHSAKERVAYVVAHEPAHQWYTPSVHNHRSGTTLLILMPVHRFGNLVSPGWWSYLWLNEGAHTRVHAASTHPPHGTCRLRYLGGHSGHGAPVSRVGGLFTRTRTCTCIRTRTHPSPSWQVWTQFVGDYVGGAQRADLLASSHPIEVDVKDAGVIGEILDAISYYKGSSVIRMLANYLGQVSPTPLSLPTLPPTPTPHRTRTLSATGCAPTSRRSSTPAPPRRTSGRTAPKPAARTWPR